LNPWFDGKLMGAFGNSNPDIENGVVRGIGLVTTEVTDVSPVQALEGLIHLCFYCYDPVNDKLANLSPLAGMKLTVLVCENTHVSDLSPLKGIQLAELSLGETPVADLSPLKEMPLKTLRCDFKPERDTEIIRSIKTLETINDKPVAEFWREVGEKQKRKSLAF